MCAHVIWLCRRRRRRRRRLFVAKSERWLQGLRYYNEHSFNNIIFTFTRGSLGALMHIIADARSESGLYKMRTRASAFRTSRPVRARPSKAVCVCCFFPFCAARMRLHRWILYIAHTQNSPLILYIRSASLVRAQRGAHQNVPMAWPWAVRTHLWCARRALVALVVPVPCRGGCYDVVHARERALLCLGSGCFLAATHLSRFLARCAASCNCWGRKRVCVCRGLIPTLSESAHPDSRACAYTVQLLSIRSFLV